MIKTLIFDFGDVFINLNKKATYNGLAKLGVTNLTQEMTDLNIRYEIGQATTAQLLSSYQSWFPNISQDTLQEIWNSILLDFPKYRLDFLKELKTKGDYQLILLSNTNDMHITWIENNVSFYPEFKEQFDQFYLSHEIQLRKPNEDIYEFVLEQNNLTPETCFFVDDTEENTQSASKVGIHSWNILPGKEDVIDLFHINQHLF